eukprot:COSAG05_NODE_45_length_25418_cov_92.923299_3_plen_93_part_00
MGSVSCAYRVTFAPLTPCHDTVTKNWAIAWVFNFGHQLLDAMDGTMARMFNLQTDLGAKLDEFTDIFFGAVTALGALYVRGRALLYPNNIAA